MYLNYMDNKKFYLFGEKTQGGIVGMVKAGIHALRDS